MAQNTNDKENNNPAEQDPSKTAQQSEQSGQSSNTEQNDEQQEPKQQIKAKKSQKTPGVEDNKSEKTLKQQQKEQEEEEKQKKKEENRQKRQQNAKEVNQSLIENGDDTAAAIAMLVKLLESIDDKIEEKINDSEYQFIDHDEDLKQSKKYKEEIKEDLERYFGKERLEQAAEDVKNNKETDLKNLGQLYQKCQQELPKGGAKQTLKNLYSSVYNQDMPKGALASQEYYHSIKPLYDRAVEAGELQSVKDTDKQDTAKDELNARMTSGANLMKIQAAEQTEKALGNYIAHYHEVKNKDNEDRKDLDPDDQKLINQLRNAQHKKGVSDRHQADEALEETYKRLDKVVKRIENGDGDSLSQYKEGDNKILSTAKQARDQIGNKLMGKQPQQNEKNEQDKQRKPVHPEPEKLNTEQAIGFKPFDKHDAGPSPNKKEVMTYHMTNADDNRLRDGGYLQQREDRQYEFIQQTDPNDGQPYVSVHAPKNVTDEQISNDLSYFAKNVKEGNDQQRVTITIDSMDGGVQQNLEEKSHNNRDKAPLLEGMKLSDKMQQKLDDEPDPSKQTNPSYS